jgi:hypothetical protein
VHSIRHIATWRHPKMLVTTIPYREAFDQRASSLSLSNTNSELLPSDLHEFMTYSDDHVTVYAATLCENHEVQSMTHASQSSIQSPAVLSNANHSAVTQETVHFESKRRRLLQSNLSIDEQFLPSAVGIEPRVHNSPCVPVIYNTNRQLRTSLALEHPCKSNTFVETSELFQAGASSTMYDSAFMLSQASLACTLFPASSRLLLTLSFIDSM